MAAPYTDTGNIAGPVNVKFQQTLLRNTKARCPYFVGSMPATIETHGGSFTAKWRKIENLTPTTSPLSELTGNLSVPTRDATNPTVTDITKELSKYGQYILLNEEVDLVNFNGQADKLSEILGISAGRSLNRLQRNEVEDNATVIYADGAGSDGGTTSKLLRSDIRKGGNVLQRNVAEMFTAQSTGSQNFNTTPVRPAYWGICHVDVEEDIRLMNGFKPVENYAGHTQTAQGEFGMVGAVRFLSTPEASIDANAGGTNPGSLREDGGSGGIDLYSTVVFGREAVGSLGLGTEHVKETYKAGDNLPAVIMINKPRGSAGALDPFNEFSTMAWKSWHGAKILEGDHIRVLRSGATEL